jgi:hypothetical protein
MTRIDVLDPGTGEQLFSCTGPDLYGGCKQATPGGKLPCNGLLLQPSTEVGLLGTFEFEVVGDGPSCPMRFCMS